LDRRHARMKPEEDAFAVADDLLVVGVAEESEHDPVDRDGRLDDERRVARPVGVDPLELRSRLASVLCQVVLAAVRDPLELLPADGEEVLEVARREGVVGAFVGIVLADAEVVLTEPEIEVPAAASVDPVAVPLVSVTRRDEELHLHLLELAQPEEEVARRDLVPERLADLSDTERRLAARELGDVLEVDEDALRRFGPEVCGRALVLEGADVRLEHEVELARLGEVAVGRFAGVLARLAATTREL